MLYPLSYRGVARILPNTLVFAETSAATQGTEDGYHAFQENACSK